MLKEFFVLEYVSFAKLSDIKMCARLFASLLTNFIQYCENCLVREFRFFLKRQEKHLDTGCQQQLLKYIREGCEQSAACLQQRLLLRI